MSNSTINVISYKQTKEDIKEFAKDMKSTGKWLVKTSKKLKKFNDRDIFDEHDSVAKQLKEVDKKVNEIISVLSETIKRTGEVMEDVDLLYKAVLMSVKRIKYLEDNKSGKLSLSEALARRNILGQV